MTVTLTAQTGAGGAPVSRRRFFPVVSALAALAALFFAGLVFAVPACAYTLVDTDITEDTVWTQAYSPYIVCQKAGGGEPQVASGVTLTIEEGVEVQLGQGTASRETPEGGTITCYVAEGFHVRGTL